MEKWIMLAVAVLMCGCRGSVSPRADLLYWDDRNFVDLTDSSFDLTEKVGDWDFAVLEQNEDCVLDGVWQIVIENEHVFIVNNVDVECDIHHFDTDGRYLNRISRQGSGYDFVTALVPDRFRDRLYLLDIFGQSIHLYRYNGDYLRSYRPYPYLANVVSASFVDSLDMLGYYGITKGEQLSYFMADTTLVITDTLDMYQVSSNNPGVLNFSGNAVSIYKNNILLIKPFCDTLFTYRNRTLEPIVYTKVGRSLPEGFSVEPGTDCVELKDRLDKQLYYSKSAIFETDRHIWLAQGPFRYMYDKESQNGIYFRDSIHYHTDIYPPMDFVGKKGNTMVCLVKGDEVLEIRDKMTEIQMEATGKLKKLFDSVGPEDRILCYYRFQ